jgi:signal transduction histidine kinase
MLKVISPAGTLVELKVISHSFKVAEMEPFPPADADGLAPEQAANRPPAAKSAKTRRKFIPLLFSLPGSRTYRARPTGGYRIGAGCARSYTRNEPFLESTVTTPSYTTPAAVDVTAVPREPHVVQDEVAPSRLWGRVGQGAVQIGMRPRIIQAGLDLAGIGFIVLAFAHTAISAEFLFHCVFTLLVLHAFLFGLRGTLLRIGLALVPLLLYADAKAFGWEQPPLELTEWPLMFVIAALVAWMAEKRNSTSRRYAALFRRASERLLTVEEDERRRIAGELHDGVGQVLTALTLTLDAAELEPDAAVARRRVASARQLADTALAGTRDLSHRIRPARLEERGLVAAVRDLASQSGFPVAVYADDASGDPHLLGPTATVEVFRIIQEALANAAHHSGAPRAQVAITRQDERLTVVVADEGQGFDPAEVPESGIGIAGMLERSRLLGGQLSIESAPHAGTRVTVSLSTIPVTVAR